MVVTSAVTMKRIFSSTGDKVTNVPNRTMVTMMIYSRVANLPQKLGRATVRLPE